jgi:hypothetical protein
VAIAQDKPDNITESIRFDTTSPEETFAKIKVRLSMAHTALPASLAAGHEPDALPDALP